MKKVLRWLGIGTGSVAGLAVVAIGVLYAWSSVEMRRGFDVAAAPLIVPDDSASIAHGRHWVRSIAKCLDCHGRDFSGSVFLDDPMLGRIAAPNITPAGVTADYTDADWIRTIRHGVKPDRRSLLVMPTMEYNRIGDEDLAAMVAYLKTLPPAGNDSLPSMRVGPMGRFLIVSNAFPVLSATAIDHAAPRVPVPAAAASAAYGEYLTSVGCIGCHGDRFSGGQPPAPPTPALVGPGGAAHWTYDQFRTALKLGLRPDGRVLSPEMPWNLTTEMSELEIEAVWVYLQSLKGTELQARN